MEQGGGGGNSFFFKTQKNFKKKFKTKKTPFLTQTPTPSFSNEGGGGGGGVNSCLFEQPRNFNNNHATNE